MRKLILLSLALVSFACAKDEETKQNPPPDAKASIEALEKQLSDLNTETSCKNQIQESQVGTEYKKYESSITCNGKTMGYDDLQKGRDRLQKLRGSVARARTANLNLSQQNLVDAIDSSLLSFENQLKELQQKGEAFDTKFLKLESDLAAVPDDQSTLGTENRQDALYAFINAAKNEDKRFSSQALKINSRIKEATREAELLTRRFEERFKATSNALREYFPSAIDYIYYARIGQEFTVARLRNFESLLEVAKAVGADNPISLQKMRNIRSISFDTQWNRIVPARYRLKYERFPVDVENARLQLQAGVNAEILSQLLQSVQPEPLTMPADYSAARKFKDQFPGELIWFQDASEVYNAMTLVSENRIFRDFWKDQDKFYSVEWTFGAQKTALTCSRGRYSDNDNKFERTGYLSIALEDLKGDWVQKLTGLIESFDVNNCQVED